MKRTLKVCIIGDGSAGKTSLRSRYLHNSFQKAYISTIGTDFVSRTIEIKIPVPRFTSLNKGKSKDNGEGGKILKKQNGRVSQSEFDSKISQANGNVEASTSALTLESFEEEIVKVTLQIWDTAGQERFKSLGSAFYRGSDAVIIAFDLSAKGALARTINWFNDFCRLGDIANEIKGMNARQLKKAREEREQFCWVGVGCKSDLLSEDVDSSAGDGDEWKGTSWAEARGWFDTVLPRYIPEGADTQQNPGTQLQSSPVNKATSYKIGDDIPARPEDVLSRPNRTTSISIPGISIQSDAQSGRPSEAGLAPGMAPTPGSAILGSLKSDGANKKKKGRNRSRKSIRSIEVWQSDHQLGSSSDSNASRSTSFTTQRAGKGDERSRKRFDSAASAGAPSVYYSVRGSTVFSNSPAGGNSGLGLDLGDSVSSISRELSGKSVSRSQSTASHNRSHKQSNLLQVEGQEDDTENKSSADSNQRTVSQRTNSSSNTIRGAKAEEHTLPNETSVEAEVEGDSLESDDVAISTIPSGDPIPFPSGDDLDAEEDDPIRHEVPIRRASRRQTARPMIVKEDVIEGETGRKANLVAKEAKYQRLESEEEQVDGEAEFDKRATLYSARPSSISSTIKGADEEEASEDSNEEPIERDPGAIYKDQVIEQGFRLFFTSAKEGHGIDEVFEHIARRVAIRWKLEEYEEQREQESGRSSERDRIQTAPPTDEEIERERMKRAIKISSGKGTGNCCF